MTEPIYTHTWSIVSLSRQPDTGRVVTAHWQLVSTDGSESNRIYGSVGFPDDSEMTIPYENLTEETVLGWVQGLEETDKVTLEAMQESSIVAKQEANVDGIPWA